MNAFVYTVNQQGFAPAASQRRTMRTEDGKTRGVLIAIS